MRARRALDLSVVVVLRILERRFFCLSFGFVPLIRRSVSSGRWELGKDSGVSGELQGGGSLPLRELAAR